MIQELGQRGRDRSLPRSQHGLRGDTPTAGTRAKHPRLDAGRLHQDALLFPKGSDGIASGFYWLVTVEGHVAGLQSSIVDYVTIALRPFFKEVDGVLQARYLPDQFPAFLQIDGLIKYLRVHLYLTENVGDQQGWRRNRAPTEDLFFTFSGFKIGHAVGVKKNSEVAA